MVFGIGGLAIGGWAAGVLMKRGVSAAYSKLMIASMVCVVPPALLLVAIPNPYWTLSCLAALVFFLSWTVGLVQAALQAITPNEMRGQIIAIYLVLVTIVGVGSGSSAVAAVTDYVFMNDAAVGYSITTVATTAAVLSIILLSIGIPAYKRKAAGADA